MARSIVHWKNKLYVNLLGNFWKAYVIMYVKKYLHKTRKESNEGKLYLFTLFANRSAKL